MANDIPHVEFGAGKLTRRQALASLAALGAVTALPLLAGVTAGSRKLTPPTSAIPDSYFGMHIHRAGRSQPWLPHGDSLTAWPSAKFGSWRLWDAYVSWPYLEPERGKWDFSLLDRYVSMAELERVDILLPLALTPPWASARPSEKSSYGPGNAAQPREIEDWRNYVHTLASRYRGRIRHFELWNEPNLPGFFSGRPEDLLILAREAHGILKAVDPDNTLAGPATTGDGDSLDWLDRYLALGGGQYLDVLSHHFYVAQTRPEAMVPYVEQVRRIATRHGLSGIPLWNTESGWWIENGDGQNSRAGIGQGWKLIGAEDAAAYVSRALILGWAAGLGRYFWYSWDHGGMGLVEPATKALKPAGRAYARTSEWILGAVVEKCSNQAGVWVCALKRGVRASWIIWAEDRQSINWGVPSAWEVKEIETLAGLKRTLTTRLDQIKLGQQPVLLC